MSTELPARSLPGFSGFFALLGLHLLALAGVQIDASPVAALNEPAVATVWLTPTPIAKPLSLRQLVWGHPAHSPEGTSAGSADPSKGTIWIQADQPLQAQLQAAIAQPSPAKA